MNCVWREAYAVGQVATLARSPIDPLGGSDWKESPTVNDLLAGESSPVPEVVLELPTLSEPFRLAVDEIRERHEQILMRPVPPYIGDIRGFQNRHPSGRQGLLRWSFIVPENRIAYFRTYLEDMGIRDEYFTKDERIGKMRRPRDWQPPDPPATRLVLLESKKFPDSKIFDGMHPLAGQTRRFELENPNLESSILWITFDPVTGNAWVEVARYDAERAGDWKDGED